ncbi:YqeG family HAD IIIA-type phosphatase [Deinococcus altitudinis]|uniref:YqeG family HAD IIIA-type phosphatase n=1 Tax=Deinococcus altitudinis TaxID=468914 RepID=UPI00389251FA
MSRGPDPKPSRPSGRWSSRHLLRPGVILPHIHDITPAFLESHGLKGLLLDLDNTLIPYGSYDERAEVSHWARELQAAGYPLYLLSNATHERARVWAERLGLPGVGLAGKPFAQGYRRGLNVVNLPAHQVGMVGDQLFTDILGGNWSGMFTIMVRPISDNALPHTRLTRRLERLVLKRYGHDWPRQRHGLPENSPQNAFLTDAAALPDDPGHAELIQTVSATTPATSEADLNINVHTNGRQD